MLINRPCTWEPDALSNEKRPSEKSRNPLVLLSGHAYLPFVRCQGPRLASTGVAIKEMLEYATTHTLNYGSVEGASDPFIWEQVDGQWQEPQLVRSLGDGTELGADATLKALSCGSAGNCVAGGELTPAGGPMPFFLLQRNGQWGDAQALPGFPEATSLSTYDGPKPYATVDRIVCSSGLNCIATGTFADTPIPSVFVSALIDGRWQKAEVVEPLGVPGDLAGQHLINGADCTNEGQCTVVGTSLGTAFWMRINLGS
jgi:hypothetical protein